MTYVISLDHHDRAKIICLSAYLKECVALFQEKVLGCHIDESVWGTRYMCTIAVERRSRLQEREFRKRLGRAVAEFVCEHLEPEMIREIIQHEHGLRQPEEVQQIESQVRRLLETSAWEYAKVVYANRRDKIARQLTSFLKESAQLSVDGFARFRMKTYRYVLATCVQEAVHDYLLDQEYKEFIHLLRSFVEIQPPKLDFVHLIHEGRGDFRLLHADGTPLVIKEGNDTLKEMFEYSLSREDMIVSTLLSVVPQEICLHTQDPQENVIRTLIQIFEGRLRLCGGCHHCGESAHCREDA
ncbi:sporulation protein YtxC [Laceyella putida]|uniref:Sporulation protein YtxC n=1 Tax=Laceyella putida TaxID=110101 RepID=A0ABW2RP99_9BACL